jgi:hypothetical protein
MDNQLVATNSPQQNFPLWKRGIKGDFLHAAKSLAILKISPSPSFSKRGTPEASLAVVQEVQSAIFYC